MREIPMGEHVPMRHQSEDVERLSSFSRVNIWNGLGTGKMNTGAWLAFRWWITGMIDEIIVVGPSMCFEDWRDTFEGLAWPSGLATVMNCMPPSDDIISEIVLEGVAAPRGACRVMYTTYGGARRMVDVSRNGARTDQPMLINLRGRRTAIILDESQAAALPSQQGHACHAITAASRAVISMTATPIGNPLQLRLWGMTKLVRPDVLLSHGVDSQTDFKIRYAVLHDPKQRTTGRFIPARGFPVSIHDDLVKREILQPMEPFTVTRSKEECLDLPDKVHMRRSYIMPPTARRLMDGLIDEDRAVMDDGFSVTPSNVLEERLRTMELCGGFLAGRAVHDGKLSLLRDVMAEIDENIGQGQPVLVWASRTRELIACAMVAAGLKPELALSQATMCIDLDNRIAPGQYNETMAMCERAGVGIIHGPTRDQDRVRIQSAWRAGSIKVVCAHPGVAGAGLNWQHVKATVYYSPPLGTIARSQSEDRVHRKGLKHTALYYDLVTMDGPDDAVYTAHRQQRDAATAMLDWLRSRR